MAQTPIVRFGIFCRDLHFQQWQATAIRQLLEMKGVEAALVVCDATPARKVPQSFGAKLNLLAWKFFSKAANKRSRALQMVNMEAELGAVTLMRSSATYKGNYSQYFSEEDVQSVRSHQLDFILRFGFNILRGDILTAARYGVWSFHHGDELKYRGLPAGFWEVFRGDPVAGAILQRLTDRLDGGVVLRKGFLKTDLTSYRLTRDSTYAESANWPAAVCRDIQRGHLDAIEGQPSVTKAPIYHNPSNWRMVGFVLKLAFRRVKKAFHSLLFVPVWNIGLVDAPIYAFLSPIPLATVKWLPGSKKGHYRADPFGWMEDGKLQVLFEDYDQQHEHGSIALLQVDGEEVTTNKNVISTGKHLSYPAAFMNEGNLYCLPESSATGNVVLFKRDTTTLKWELEAELIKDFPGGDPTLLMHLERWWILATDARDGANFKLHAFYADTLKGPWLPHAANPIKTDIRSARPAGTPFVEDGVLYRPAQDSSNRYGGRVSINRVVALTPDTFEEEHVCFVEPFEASAYPDGIHTLSAMGDKTLVDGLTETFVWSSWTLARLKLRQLLR